MEAVGKCFDTQPAQQGGAPARIATFKECVSPVGPGTALPRAAVAAVGEGGAKRDGFELFEFDVIHSMR
ncbi:MAG: hypothetical protein BM559_04485 [Roseobacter sp. MedPE-SWchi]|nr:MAG: hypothetical protein BM559_04485 [Roseobacter sp. MedPE-SWchi]